MAARPVVDGIDQTYRGSLTVIRLNVQDPVGRTLAAEYAFRVTPTFIFLDTAGEEVWRTMGAVYPEQVDRALATP
jgi:thioredoxin-related protein